MNIIDFIIGGLLANAMPHFIFGITKTHFLGLFGYSSKGNIMYAVLQFLICLILFCVFYDYRALITNGYLMGGISVLTLYFIFGKILVNRFGKNIQTKESVSKI